MASKSCIQLQLKSLAKSDQYINVSAVNMHAVLNFQQIFSHKSTFPSYFSYFVIFKNEKGSFKQIKC